MTARRRSKDQRDQRASKEQHTARANPSENQKAATEAPLESSGGSGNGVARRPGRVWVAVALLVVAGGILTFALWKGTQKTAKVPSGAAAAGYVDSAVCATCHADIAETYRKTGMGRSFYAPTQANAVEHYGSGNTLDHTASGMQYQMTAHDGSFFQRRTTRGPDGAAANALEERVDYIIGSGNHARTYLHRTLTGQLIEMPVSWYSEKGGYWAMSPGFDYKGQTDMHGAIGPECMFCHNGYPTLDEQASREGTDAGIFPAKLPMGIDCQRCHGPGAAHVAAATRKGANPEELSKTIVNPAHLPRDRQLEVCFECHLETSNRHAPAAVRDYTRDMYSFRPGEPLGDYKVYFERANKPPEDDFEIAHAGYQLRKSACFRNSQMTCLTCHDPHDVPHGPQAISGYIEACLRCHTGVKHTVALPVSENCISCHMPKRRSDGSVHIILTDHYIQRVRPTRDLLAMLKETAVQDDHTSVEVYYPVHPPKDARTELYAAIAQVDDSDGAKGLVHLQEVLQRTPPAPPEPYMELARALVRRHRPADALPWFDKALERHAGLLAAMREKGVALDELGRAADAVALFEKAVEEHPKDDVLLTDLGNAYLQQHEIGKAKECLDRAVAANPERGEALNLLGLVALQQNDTRQAETEFREAIRMRPDLPEAHDNLGTLLTGTHRTEEAASEFRLALFHDSRNGEAHHGLGMLAILGHDPAAAFNELKTAVELQPNNAQTHTDFADVLSARNDPASAAAEYRRAVALNPSQWEAHLGLATTLLRMNDVAGAAEQLQVATQAGDPDVRQQAQTLLLQLRR